MIDKLIKQWHMTCHIYFILMYKDQVLIVKNPTSGSSRKKDVVYPRVLGSSVCVYLVKELKNINKYYYILHVTSKIY